MAELIVVGHGSFASGLKSSVKLISGNNHLKHVDFNVDDATNELEYRIKEKISNVDKEKGILFFTDLVGGTPFKTCAIISKEYDNSVVISGTNLPMLLDAVITYQNDNAMDIVERLVSSGKEGIEIFPQNLLKIEK